MCDNENKKHKSLSVYKASDMKMCIGEALHIAHKVSFEVWKKATVCRMAYSKRGKIGMGCLTHATGKG